MPVGTLVGPLEAGRSVRIGYRSRELVASAASMFDRYRLADRALTVMPYSAELMRRDGSLTEVGRQTAAFGFLRTYEDSEQVEGGRYRVEISPGSVRIGRRDYVKWDRRMARAATARTASAREQWERDQAEACWDGCMSKRCHGCRRHDGPALRMDFAGERSAKIRSWSAKSRNAMRLRLASLDYAPLFVNFFGDETVPAMVTLTYPGDWEAVAPSNAAVRRHVEQLRLRWNRAWANQGNPFVGVWKREFQRRGAPHYHFLIVPPIDPTFREWLSETWAEIVGAAWCGEECWKSFDGRLVKGLACCERGRHVVAGTGVDFREGARAVDPRRLALYFAKHGGYSAKEYQNEGPASWLAAGGVGRFWGVIGLEPATATVEVDQATAQALARVLRRLERTKRFPLQVRTLRCRCDRTADPKTGEMRASHTKGCFRSNTVVVRRFRGSLGFVIVNDGPALAATLARAAAVVVQGRAPVTGLPRSGLGPVGFLP